MSPQAVATIVLIATFVLLILHNVPIAFSIGLSTVLIRIHYAMDIVCGLLISELVFRLVFKPLHETKALDAVPKPAARALSLALLVAGFTGFALLVQN